MAGEIVKNNSLDNIDSNNIMDDKILSSGLFDALESNDKILLLDFSGSMHCVFEDKRLYKHLIDAVRKYEREYTMIRFESESSVITCLDNEKPSGATYLEPALKMAYNLKSKEYIVVSDGLPHDGDECLKFAMSSNMRISTMFIGDDRSGKEFMNKLANMTGGKSNDIRLLAGFGGMLEKKIMGLIEGQE